MLRNPFVIRRGIDVTLAQLRHHPVGLQWERLLSPIRAR